MGSPEEQSAGMPAAYAGGEEFAGENKDIGRRVSLPMWRHDWRE